MAHIRPATPDDLDAVTRLLLADAEARAARDPVLWRMHAQAKYKVRASVEVAIASDEHAFRQRWLVAETMGEGIVGVIHTIQLPVPPIYAGASGPPGLIMEDCALLPGAPPALAVEMIAAAEADLREQGARVLLASSVPGGPFELALAARGYEPLTLYLSKSGLSGADAADVRRAVAEDVPAIVTLSADSRRVLHALDPFWAPHPDAAARFGGWMEKSLILPDRDMAVMEAGDGMTGYVISQPVTPLHLPPAHETAGVGLIDDYHHRDLGDATGAAGPGAAALLAAAEADLAARGTVAALVVCPAAWGSKRAVIEGAGYTPALVWRIASSSGAR